MESNKKDFYLPNGIKIKNVDKYEKEKALLLFPYEERAKMRRDKKFIDTNKPWNDGSFNRPCNICEICELTRKFHKAYTEHTFEEWEEFYFTNGKRLINLYLLSIKFSDFCESYGITLSENEAFNYCYIRVIDESYIGYKRELRVFEKLCAQFPDISFRSSSTYELDAGFGIDIAIFKERKLSGAFQVKSPYAGKRKNVPLENSVRFNKCFKKFGFSPIYLIADDDGNIFNLDEVKEYIKNHS